MSDDEQPTDEALRGMIRKLVPKVNLQKTGIKSFTKLLQKECGGIELKTRSQFIKDALSEAINELEGSDSDQEPAAPKKAAAKVKKAAAKAKAPPAPKPEKKKRKAGKGLSIPKEISKELAELLQKGPEMSRTEIVKALWDYIKEKELQNPENKREIILDENMKKVFGIDRFTMFTMNKYIAAHVHPFKEVDLTEKPKKEPKKRKRKVKEEAGAARKKRKAKKPGLQPPYKLSEDMAKVVGKDILPRPQVVTALWHYIKSNELQNPSDKREIICDDLLKNVMGGEQRVTMFNMNRYITQHLLEKLDRSAYNYEDDKAGDVFADAEEGANSDEEDEEEEEEV
jgi:upstream activation factor subunit UAF30